MDKVTVYRSILDVNGRGLPVGEVTSSSPLVVIETGGATFTISPVMNGSIVVRTGPNSALSLHPGGGARLFRPGRSRASCPICTGGNGSGIWSKGHHRRRLRMGVEWKCQQIGPTKFWYSKPFTMTVGECEDGRVTLDGKPFFATLDAAKAEAVRRAVEWARARIKADRAFLEEVGERE